MSMQAVHDHIRKLIANNDVVLFMKGNKSMAQCGFSHQVDTILQHLGVDYKDVNVLQSVEIREGIKSFSNWPTIPQLYIKGEFVGGCDIVKEMFQHGELQQLLDEKGVKYSKQTMTA
jgi:monothiol glutaredoxin